MIEPQGGSVQGLSRKRTQRFGCRLAENPRRQFAASPIDRVTDQPVAGMRHMHAKLMRSPRFQPTFDQGYRGRMTKGFDDSRAGHRMAPPVEHNGLFLAVGLVPRELRGDPHDVAAFKADTLHPSQARVARIRNTVNKRPVMPFNGM